jgi:UDP-N-acetylglucosamine 4-epimerase
VDEIYADAFAACYGIETVGLRYFNAFGARQDPEGPYAAVIPRWVAAFLAAEEVCINGDGETTRDFCYIENVVEANLLAATANNAEAVNQVYNVAVGGRTSLNTLFSALRALLGRMDPQILKYEPTYRSFRAGDIRHSEADIAKARQLLGYDPKYDLYQGLEEAIEWYVRRFSPARLAEEVPVRQ